MQYFDFSLPVGAAREVHALANYVYYLDGSAGGADNTVALRKRTGSDSILLRPGQAFELPAGDSADAWIITNHAGQATITGTLLIGSGKFTDNRIPAPSR